MADCATRKNPAVTEELFLLGKKTGWSAGRYFADERNFRETSQMPR